VLGGRALGTGVTGPVAVLAVLVCAPLALLGRNAERFGELRNERLAERAETALRCHDPRAATRMNLRGMLVPFVANALMAAAGAAAVGLVVPLLLRDAPGADAALRHGWWAFCGVAAAAGARSLRSRRAGWTFTAAGAAVVLAGVLAWRGG
jgi:PTS system mannose-specific IIC component